MGGDRRKRPRGSRPRSLIPSPQVPADPHICVHDERGRSVSLVVLRTLFPAAAEFLESTGPGIRKWASAQSPTEVWIVHTPAATPCDFQCPAVRSREFMKTHGLRCSERVPQRVFTAWTSLVRVQ